LPRPFTHSVELRRFGATPRRRRDYICWRQVSDLQHLQPTIPEHRFAKFVFSTVNIGYAY
jgi:hypothetical protein